MLSANNYQSPELVNINKTFGTLPIAIEVLPESDLEILAKDLSPETPWADRQKAVRKLGQSRNTEALPILLAALPNDPFWMVRSVMIQALESIGDSRAIPVLQVVASRDSFLAIRSAAEKAVERLSQ